MLMSANEWMMLMLMKCKCKNASLTLGVLQYTSVAYVIKSNLGFKEKDVILLDQDVHMCRKR